ncbi:hypothetical protein F3157_19895 [Virgibacillus dakarensis]|uniref:Uncharacterized protein n=1 Tax=Lentibacillus populi TaxID=1827502 RepID=A0A9W5U162_9BACI|nr:MULTISPECIES: hypothetical protein [Bacillaceae]MBT2216975.1 hypothetical protein [Virgibacillus dakarensis]MTW87883.1 hypothetical protein [Virgibacillus dakarensis]GGB58814.1 hypothetical protein GCM10011409_40360 [Lentibacillus populi]
MKENKVYILLTDTGTLFTRAIKLYTKKPYNHASISFDPDLLEVYSFGRKNVKNPFAGGFVQENIQDRLYNNATCTIFSYSVTELQMQKMKHYIHQIEKEKHLYRYNFLGLLAIIVKKPIKRKNAFFCSQFVATVLQECGIYDFTKPLSLVTPHDFQESPGLQLVYQGNLSDYNQEGTDQQNAI